MIVWIVTSQNSGGSSITAWLPVVVGVIGVSGTVFGVAIGGLVSYFIKKTELAHQIKEENRKLRIARLEELHERLLEFVSITALMVTGFISMRRTGSTSRKELGELMSPASFALAKIASLLKIYARELETDFDGMNSRWNALVSRCTEFLTTSSTMDAMSLSKVQLELAEKCRELQQQVQAKIESQISP